MAEECSFELNERSTLILTVSFFDEDGVPVTPDAATYRIDSVNGNRGTNILSATAISPLDTTADIEITSEQNNILRNREAFEIRVVTIGFDYGSGKHGTAEYRYRVMNLYGVVDVPSPSVSPSASASPST
jgi:hypothetical protein